MRMKIINIIPIFMHFMRRIKFRVKERFKLLPLQMMQII
jgi:hypothetical protein